MQKHSNKYMPYTYNRHVVYWLRFDRFFCATLQNRSRPFHVTDSRDKSRRPVDWFPIHVHGLARTSSSVLFFSFSRSNSHTYLLCNGAVPFDVFIQINNSLYMTNFDPVHMRIWMTRPCRPFCSERRATLIFHQVARRVRLMCVSVGHHSAA